VGIIGAARKVLARLPLLVVSSQAVTPDCLVLARNTGQVRTGGGRAVLRARLAKGRKKIVVYTQRENQDG